MRFKSCKTLPFLRVCGNRPKGGAVCGLGTPPITSAGLPGHIAEKASAASQPKAHNFIFLAPEVPFTGAEQGFNATENPDSQVPKLLTTPQRISITLFDRSFCFEGAMLSNHYQPARQDSEEEPVAAKKSRGSIDGPPQPFRDRQETGDTVESGYTCETIDSQDLPPPARPARPSIIPNFGASPRFTAGNRGAPHPRQAIR